LYSFSKLPVLVVRSDPEWEKIGIDAIPACATNKISNRKNSMVRGINKKEIIIIKIESC
jgi:hypothetical protein